MCISDWSSDVCSSDLGGRRAVRPIVRIRTDLVFLLARHEHRSALELRGHLLAKVEFRMADHLVGADGHHDEMEHMQTHAGDTRIVERRCETGDHAVPVHVALLERLIVGRSEESRVGKECVSPGRSRWSTSHKKKKQKQKKKE